MYGLKENNIVKKQEEKRLITYWLIVYYIFKISTNGNERFQQSDAVNRKKPQSWSEDANFLSSKGIEMHKVNNVG